MGFSAKRSFYESLPLSGKRLIGLVPLPLLAGPAYRGTLRRRDFFEKASRQEIQAYQEKALAGILEFAVNEVPAYGRFRDVIKRYKALEVLREFPLVDKSYVQEHLTEFLPRNLSQIGHYQATTGGTGGNQFTLYLDDSALTTELAFVHRHWAAMGYTWRSRKATFRGVRFPNLPPGVFWQPNPIYHELQFSPFHMSEKNLPAYVETLKRFGPAYLHGYPSAIDLLAEFVLRHGLTAQMPKIRAAFLVSESCSSEQRSRIERAFGTRVFSFYGHTEQIIFGGECERSTVYHQVPDYGILEIIDEGGKACSEDGQRGEIVGTGFWNRSLPLIRYRTGDFAVWRAPTCECGRHWDRFDRVEGRWKQDMLIGSSGARISVTALNMHGQMFDKVVRYQYYQDTPGVCILKIIPAPHFSEADRLSIHAAYSEKVGEELDMRVQTVSDIPLTSRGKLRVLDSKLRLGDQLGTSTIEKNPEPSL